MSETANPMWYWQHHLFDGGPIFDGYEVGVLDTLPPDQEVEVYVLEADGRYRTTAFDKFPLRDMGTCEWSPNWEFLGGHCQKPIRYRVNGWSAGPVGLCSRHTGWLTRAMEDRGRCWSLRAMTVADAKAIFTPGPDGYTPWPTHLMSLSR